MWNKNKNSFCLQTSEWIIKQLIRYNEFNEKWKKTCFSDQKQSEIMYRYHLNQIQAEILIRTKQLTDWPVTMLWSALILVHSFYYLNISSSCFNRKMKTKQFDRYEYDGNWQRFMEWTCNRLAP